MSERQRPRKSSDQQNNLAEKSRSKGPRADGYHTVSPKGEKTSTNFPLNSHYSTLPEEVHHSASRATEPGAAISPLKSISINTAMIASDGRIIAVNDAWRKFADENGSAGQYYVGLNYLSVCEAAAALGDSIARQALDGLRAVTKGEVGSFELEYPCHSPTEQRWFRMRADRIGPDRSEMILMHVDLTAGKSGEEALAKSHQMFFETFNLSPAIMSISRLSDGQFVAVNSAFESRSGWTKGEVAGRTSIELGLWESADDYWRTFRPLVDAGRLDNWECRIRTKSGELLTGHLSAAPVRIDGDQCVVSVFEDVTAQREAEEELRQSEQKFRAMLELAPDAFFIVDQDGRMIEVNEAACQQLTYSRADLLNLNIADFVSRDSAVDIGQRLLDVTDTGTFYEIRFIRSDGTKLPVELNIRRVILGGRRAILGIARDITERREVQERLRSSESKYRRLHESMTDGFALVDMQGRIREHNAVFASMLGLSSEGLLELSYEQITPQAWHGLERDIIRNQVLSRGFSDVYEKEYRRKDGTTFPVELRTFLLKSEQGEVEGMWAIVRDITKRKHAEQQLKLATDELLALNAKLAAEQAQLQNKHAALREVLQHVEDDKNEVRLHISENMKMIIAPLLRSLKKTTAKNQRQEQLINVLEKALDDVTSPFVRRVSTKFEGLTPREIQVCRMVKDGLPSKEIAEYLGISVLTVNKLRQQIRQKLQIDNKEVGLSEYLQKL